MMNYNPTQSCFWEQWKTRLRGSVPFGTGNMCTSMWHALGYVAVSIITDIYIYMYIHFLNFHSRLACSGTTCMLASVYVDHCFTILSFRCMHVSRCPCLYCLMCSTYLNLNKGTACSLGPSTKQPAIRLTYECSTCTPTTQINSQWFLV